MQRSRAVVFANGDYDKANSEHAEVSSNDFLLCVDGGVRHCLTSGFRPDLLIGDLDSLDSDSCKILKELGTERIQFPREKDASDLELAFEVLAERSFDEVVVLGASGGRTDHHLFNWQLFGSRSWPFQLRIIDDYVDAQHIDTARSFNSEVRMGQTFSVIPLAGTATGVQVSGAQYPLKNATLVQGSTIGLSNAVTQSRLQVSVEEGIVLLMFVLSER